MKELVKIKKGLDLLIETSFNNQETINPSLIFEELSSDKNLQLLYYCVNNLQHPPMMVESEVADFIEENIKLASQIDSSILTEASKSVSELELSEIESAIGMVLFETRNAINFTKYNASKRLILETILNKTKQSDLDLSSFDAKDVEFVKSYIKNPEESYKSVCNECLSIIDNKLNETDLDVETESLLYQTKIKLLENQINCKFLPENVIDILNLKKNLID